MTPTPSRVRTALLAGVATAAYYATPDVVRARTPRGWLKAGLLVVTAAASVPDVRAALAAWRKDDGPGALPDDGDAAAGPDRAPDANITAGTHSTDGGQEDASASVGGVVAAAGIGAAVLAAATVLVVAAERWIFDRGEARAAAGARLPHTRAGLLLGVLAAGLALVPSPDDADGVAPATGSPAARG